MKINLTGAALLASVSPLNTAIIKRTAEPTKTVTVTKTVYVTVTGGNTPTITGIAPTLPGGVSVSVDNTPTVPIVSISGGKSPTSIPPPPVVSIPIVTLPVSSNPIVTGTGPSSSNPPGQLVTVCPTGLQTYDCVVVSFGAGGSSVASFNVVQVSETVVNGKTSTVLSTEAPVGGNQGGTTLKTVTKTASPIGNEETVTVTAQPTATNGVGNLLSSILSIISSITHQTSTPPVIKSTPTPVHVTTSKKTTAPPKTTPPKTTPPKTTPPSPPKTTAKGGSGGGGKSSSKGE